MKRAFRRFLGVDLGGGKGKTTAVARLELGPDGILEIAEVGTHKDGREPWYDETLLAYLRDQREGAVVAMDAPLTTTACVRCRETVCPGMSRCVDPTVVWFRTVGERLIDESGPPERERIATTRASGSPRAKKPVTTPYTQRATEVWLHRHQIIPRETLGQGMGPLTARAAYLTRALAASDYALHENLIEVYPKATIHQLWGEAVARRYKREVDTWETRAHILESLRGVVEFGKTSRMAREDCLRNDHCFDAVISAYTAFLWARDGWSLPVEDRAVFAADGWIYSPRV